MEISAVAAIKKYMELNGDRSVTMEEMKALSKEERDELGALAAKELG